MKVRAIKRGFFGGLYRLPGGRDSEFECPSESFSSNWMEKITEDTKPLEVEAYKPLEIPSLMNKGKEKKTKTLSLKK